MKLRTAIYLILLIGTVLLSVDIWFVANSLMARQVSYLFWEGGINMLLLLVLAIVNIAYFKDEKYRRARNGSLIMIGIMASNTIVMLNYATTATLLERLTFYFLLSITSSLFLVVGMIGNITGIEKEPEKGFGLDIHSKNSPIPAKLIIPIWLIVFFGMGAFVSISGSVLVSYPSFGALSYLGGPMTSGFGVGSWENICFIIFPFSLAFSICKYLKFPVLTAFLIALLVGASTFTTYHTLVYLTNMVATIVVLAFGFIGLLSYYSLKSVVVLDSLHCGNNFWGAFFSVNVVAFAVGSPAPFAISIMPVIGIVAITAVSIYLLRKKNKGRGI